MDFRYRISILVKWVLRENVTNCKGLTSKVWLWTEQQMLLIMWFGADLVNMSLVCLPILQRHELSGFLPLRNWVEETSAFSYTLAYQLITVVQRRLGVIAFWFRVWWWSHFSEDINFMSSPILWKSYGNDCMNAKFIKMLHWRRRKLRRRTPVRDRFPVVNNIEGTVNTGLRRK